MSTFAVTIETLESVSPHPNADRLDIGRLAGIAYQFVLAKGSHKTGDQVLYFPIDAVLPDDLIAKLGLTGRLSGKAKNRVKTIKLRGEISQGITGPLDLLPPGVYPNSGRDGCDASGNKLNFAEDLGVTKYEPPERFSNGPNGTKIRLNPLPSGVSKYDIENCERYGEQLQLLMDVPCCITEKVEGSHFIATEFPDGTRKLCSRNCEIVDDGTFWHRGAQNSDIWGVLEDMKEQWGIDGSHITIRGELIGPGVQGNYYEVQDFSVLVFDVEIDGRPVHAGKLFSSANQFMIGYVPTLNMSNNGDDSFTTLREWLGGRDIREASNGMSLLNPKKMREGIVIKPLEEQYDRKLGRLFLKQRSPDYLAGSEL